MIRLLSLLALRADRFAAEWLRRLAGHRALVALSDRALHDLALSRSDAWAEYEKPFWRP